MLCLICFIHIGSVHFPHFIKVNLFSNKNFASPVKSDTVFVSDCYFRME